MKALLRPNAPPPDPVKEICGKNSRLRDTDFGVCSDQNLLGLTDIGPALQQRRWQSRRHFGREGLFHQRASARNALRVVAQKNADGILFLRDLSLQVGDLRVCGIEDLLGLEYVEFRCHAVLDAEFRELNGIFLGLYGLVGDLELQIELQEREIVAGDVAHQRQDHGLPCILGGQELSAGRFRGTAQLAEKVQLERRIGRQSQKVVFGLKVAFFSAGEIAVSLRPGEINWNV